ncbi:MAG: hypothetical protein AB7S63_01545 [Thauera sp.]|jgi:hypothetical protein
MKTTLTQKLLTVLLCSGLLAGAGAAEARGDRDDRGWDKPRHAQSYKYRHSNKHAYKHAHKRSHRGWDERRVVRERVIVRERPRHYRETIVHEHYYEPRYRSYSYSRSPALVIGVDIPPLVIPLR